MTPGASSTSGTGTAPQAAAWWGLAPPGELADQDAALAMLERRWKLVRAHRDRSLKLWYPWETRQGGWLATWVGEPAPGEHRETGETELYEWLEASLGGTS